MRLVRKGRQIAPGTGEAIYDATTYAGARLARPARVQLILSAGGGQLRINHSPPQGIFSVLGRCVATSAGGTRAAAGAQVFRADQRPEAVPDAERTPMSSTRRLTVRVDLGP